METAIKERPILFSAPMVRAVLADSKTQARRVVKWPVKSPTHHISVNESDQGPIIDWCPYGQPGDHLWVRESFGFNHAAADAKDVLIYRADYEKGQSVTSFKNERKVLRPWGEIEYEQSNYWHTSTSMKRQDSRILLEIVAVRAERLTDISEADSIAEGAMHYSQDVLLRTEQGQSKWCRNSVLVHAERGLARPGAANSLGAFRTQWDSDNSKALLSSWRDNPWVWVIEFRRIDA